MFDSAIYKNRRQALRNKVQNGLILILGNNEAPANYPDNTYKFRQDSSFLYFFGNNRDGLVGIIDVDNNKEYLLGDDINIDDIIWYGNVDSISVMAEHIGVENVGPFAQVSLLIEEAQKESERIKKDLIFEAREESNKLKETLEKEIKEKKDEVKEMENRLVLREQNMDKRDETFQKREQLKSQ
jgi:Xaa-Pro aminopeptidase